MMQMGTSTSCWAGESIPRDEIHWTINAPQGAPSCSLNSMFNTGLVPASARCPKWPYSCTGPKGDAIFNHVSETLKVWDINAHLHVECINSPKIIKIKQEDIKFIIYKCEELYLVGGCSSGGIARPVMVRSVIWAQTPALFTPLCLRQQSLQFGSYYD